jgi:hypothetical protein
MKNLLMISLLIISTSAFADEQIHIEPGPIQKINAAGMIAMDAMLKAKPADLAQFVKSGNTMKEVTVQQIGPGRSVYNYTRQMCMLGGFTGGTCLGGAQLQVVIESIQQGSNVVVKASSRISLIR